MNICIFDCNCTPEILINIIKTTYDGDFKLIDIKCQNVTYVDQTKIRFDCEVKFKQLDVGLNSEDLDQHFEQINDEFTTIEFVVSDGFVYIDMNNYWSSVLFDFQFIEEYQKAA